MLRKVSITSFRSGPISSRHLRQAMEMRSRLQDSMDGVMFILDISSHPLKDYGHNYLPRACSIYSQTIRRLLFDREGY